MTMQVSHLTKIRIIGMMVIMLVFSSRPAYAHEIDTHYVLTYVMCRAAGLSHDDALTVAQCDQGMDDSDATLANHGPGGVIPQPREEGLWHALPAAAFVKDPTKISIEEFAQLAKIVLARKEEMFQTALNRPDRLRKLQYLGVFFHYQQDSWAHRIHPNANPSDGFFPYFQPMGHAVHGHQPDRAPFDPVCSLRCLEEGIAYVRRFMKEGLNQTPSPLFDNYSPANGRIDDAWPGKGEFINQILIDKSTVAREFVTTLIRAQVDSYTNGLEIGNPFFGGRYTSNEASYGVVRENFQRVCKQFNVPEQIPAYLVPLSNLSTEMILAGETLPIPKVAEPETIVTIKSNLNGEFICATDGLKDNQWLYCKKGIPLTFVLEGPLHNCALRVKGEKLYLSYNNTTGAVKLWSSPEDAYFSLELQTNGTYGIKNIKHNQYIWLNGASPYITGKGTPSYALGQWRISGLPTPEKKTISIQSTLNNKFVCATDGLTNNQWLWCKDGTPVTFVVEGPLSNCVLKVQGQNLYFSYNATTGAVKLWNSPSDAYFSLEQQPNGTYAIKNNRYNQYVWLAGESPYITHTGSPNNALGQWRISGL